MIPLSKTLDPEDLLQLTDELRLVDDHFTDEAMQHPMRRWEYAMALAAVKRWDHLKPALVAYDIGGGGSPFAGMLADETGSHVHIVDPTYTPNAYTLQQLLRHNPKLGDIVTCLSVLEHVEDLDAFLYHLGCLVAPGGLLFLTLDYADDYTDDWPVDRFHFNWMRKRIFNAYGWRLAVAEQLQHHHHFTLLGDIDPHYHGAHVYDYTFASLALQKRA